MLKFSEYHAVLCVIVQPFLSFLKGITFLLGLFLLQCQSSNPPIYIGLVGPMSGKGQAYGQSMHEALALLVDEVNKGGGIHGRPLKLVIKDDQNKPEIARLKAQEFVTEKKVSLVIGHYYSSANLAAQDIYRRAQIPTITPSATNVLVTQQSPWMFRTTFNDDFQGKFLAHYARHMMGAKQVMVIYDEDAFGSGLREAFLEAAQKIGLKEIASFSYQNRNPDYSFVYQLKKFSNTLLFLASHAPEAAELVPLIKKSGFSAPILGPDSLGSKGFLDKVGLIGEGVFAATPFLLDLAKERTQIFSQHYKQHYGKEPDWQAAFTYDAGLLAIAALKSVGKDGSKIRDFLASINSPEKGIQGVTGNNFFNEVGDMKKPPAVGRLTHGQLISTLTQLQIPEGNLEPEDLAKLKQQDLLMEVEETPFIKTHVVYTGIDMIDVLNFDENLGTFKLDFYLWMRWEGDIDPTAFELKNGTLRSKKLVQRKFLGNRHYAVFRVTADVKEAAISLTAPASKQVLRVSLRHKKLPKRFLTYVVDKLGLRETSPNLALTPWKVTRQWQYSGIHQHHLQTEHQYSTYHYAMELKRAAFPDLAQVIFPLSLVLGFGFMRVFIA